MTKYQHDSHTIQFELIKTIEDANNDTLGKIINIIDSVSILSYDRIKIPNMKYERKEDQLVVNCEYIKGTILDPKVHTHFRSIIFEDFVLSENKYSVTDYHPRNFIIQDKTFDLYYVDIYGIQKSNIDTRKKSFNRYFL